MGFEDSGTLSVGARLSRIEQRLDKITARLDDVVGRSQLQEHEIRVRALERLADRFDPTELQTRHREWQEMRSAFTRIDTIESYRRWLFGSLIGGFLGVGGLVVAVITLVHSWR